MTPIRSRASLGTYVIVLCFAAFFAALSAIFLVKGGDAKPLLLVLGVFAFLFINIAMIRFECTEALVTYDSLLKHQHIRIEDITGVVIGPIDLGKRSPQFILNTVGGRVVLFLRSLRLADVQRFAAYLMERGIPISIEQDFMSKRMAAQILPGHTTQA
ncbi:MAG TPA: hypothetical protein VG733_06045 [Chthoniobacteraceae bacterium]|nr:hypothetical protein [Chthoniobacteraceae bacterium]